MINNVLHCIYRIDYLVNQLWTWHCTILKNINWDHYVSLFSKHRAIVAYTVNFGNIQIKRSIYTIIFRCIYYNKIDINFLTNEFISYLYFNFYMVNMVQNYRIRCFIPALCPSFILPCWYSVPSN